MMFFLKDHSNVCLENSLQNGVGERDNSAVTVVWVTDDAMMAGTSQVAVE